MTTEQRWVYCDDCDDWIGEVPPYLPNYWSSDKTAAMHKRGTGHSITRVAWSDIIWPESQGTTPVSADPATQ